MTCRKFQLGDIVINTLTKEKGIIAEITKYGYLVNYSDETGIKFRKSKEENLTPIKK